MSGKSENIIELKHISKVYSDNGFKAVDDFNLEVKRGEFVTFLGQFGCRRYRAGGIHSFLAITEKSENNGFCSRLFVQGSGPSLPQLSRAFESETSLRGKSEMGRGDGGGFGG